MTESTSTHSAAEIRAFLKEAPVAVIATAAGEDIRLRMMHLGFEDDFTVYLASLHGDPKITQLLHNPSLSILVNRLPEDIRDSEEVEYTGRATLIRNAEEREKCLVSTARYSPIVQALTAQGQTGVLDCVKIVPQQIKYRKFKEIVTGTPPTVLEFPTNRQVVNDWARLKTRLNSWWVAIRPNSLAGVLASVVLGGAVAWQQAGAFHWGWFVLTMLGGLLLQAGTNVLNDYNDHRTGADAANRNFVRPFSGGSRVIQLGLLTPLDTLAGGLVMCLAAIGLGIYFVFAGRPWVLVLAMVGALSGYIYNAAHEWSAVKAGMGELFVAADFGLLVTLGAFYVQTGYLAWAPVLASIPVTLLITAVLFINQFQDEEGDQRTGKLTAVVRLGRQKAAAVFPIYFVAAFAALLGLVALGRAPVTTLLALISLPAAWLAISICRTHWQNNVDLAPANGYTALTHLAFGLLQAAGYLTGGAVVALAIAGLAFSAYLFWYTDRIRRAATAVKKAMA